MTPKLLITLVPFLLPFVGYALYVVLTKRAAARGKALHEAPWYWLACGGLALAILALGASAFWGGAPPGSTYVPAEMRNGEIVPGRFR